MDAGWSSAAAVAVPDPARRRRAGAGRGGRSCAGGGICCARNVRLVAGYGLVAVAGCQLAYFNAVAHMQVGVALLIEYTAPVAVVGWLWLAPRPAPRPADRRSAPARRRRPGAGPRPGLRRPGRAPRRSLWALGAMVGAAVYFVLSSGEDNGLPPTVLAAGGLALGGVALLVAGAAGVVDADRVHPPVAFDGGHRAVVAAGARARRGDRRRSPTSPASRPARRLGSRLASFVALLEVLVALVFAWLLLGELPRLIQVARRGADPGRRGRRSSSASRGASSPP